MQENLNFTWQRQPKVEHFLLHLTDNFCKSDSIIADLATKMQDLTSTRMLDWVDHFIVEDSSQIHTIAENLGYQKTTTDEGSYYLYKGLTFPPLLLEDKSRDIFAGIALRVESLQAFLQCNNLTGDIVGEPLAPVRKVLCHKGDNAALYAVERRGNNIFQGVEHSHISVEEYLRAVELWHIIPRNLPDRAHSLEAMKNTCANVVKTLGQNLAAHVVCEGERNYWMSRNHVARTQKMRQDILGLGWANHDHHTFRSSRENFNALVNLFMSLGFEKRERFYAGAEAGWGAQVMEQPTTGHCLFLDVDLAPDEIELDFSQHQLEEREELGTVGLWCALHGDSILGAGMHHLAGNFLFNDLAVDLAQFSIDFMAPFSDFEYLKQAFSKGEMWQVQPHILQNLIQNGHITEEKAALFLQNGVLGSHLENIQRGHGYKGFNQKNVNHIIKDTDPRRYE